MACLCLQFEAQNVLRRFSEELLNHCSPEADAVVLRIHQPAPINQAQPRDTAGNLRCQARGVNEVAEIRGKSAM